MLQKMPKRIIADHQAAVGQLPEESAQRQIRLLGDPRQNPIALARHKVRPATAHPQRGRTADGALALRPLPNAGAAAHERLGPRTAGLPRRDRRHHTLPQVQRISSRHPRWPPNPASRLNLTRALLESPSIQSKQIALLAAHEAAVDLSTNISSRLQAARVSRRKGESNSASASILARSARGRRRPDGSRRQYRRAAGGYR